MGLGFRVQGCRVRGFGVLDGFRDLGPKDSYKS